MRTLICLTLALALSGCEFEIDTERDPAPRGTFGEEVFRILKADLDRMQPAKGQALGTERDRFVRAIDGLMPEAQLDGVQNLMVAMLPLYDAGRMQAVLRPAACILTSELSTDDDLHRAARYVRRTEGYGDDRLLMPLLLRFTGRPDAPDLLAELADLWLYHDGLDTDFVPSDEDATFGELLADVSRHLADREVEPVDPDSGWATFRDWLLSEDPRLDDGAGGPDAQWVVRVDQRGRALVAPDPGTGQPPPPFVDSDSDGLVDLDPVTGDYLDSGGQPFEAPAPFSPAGERPRVAGRLVYRYADLAMTPLAALVAQIEPLVADGFLWDMPDTLPALLGPLTALADEDGVYAGYDPDSAPIMAGLHAVLALADYPRLPQLLEALLTLAELHEPQLARLLAEAEEVGDILDEWPQVSTRNHNRLIDDLMPHLVQMAERTYLLRVLESFDDPGWRQLGPGLIDMIRYRSVSPPGWDYYDDYDTFADYQLVRQPMDWTQPDTVYDNRSNLQRGVHLIHDTRGVLHAVTVAGYDAYEIPNMLSFYLDSTGGFVDLAWYVPVAVLEFSDTTPTTEEINRFMVNDHGILGNPTGLEGFDIRAYNGEALMAMEFSGLLAGLKPMWSTVVALDRDLSPSGTEVLGDLLAAVHPHYSCNLPYASEACADLRPLEPMLLQILEQTEIVDAVVDLMYSLQNRQTPSGYWVLGELDQFLRHLLKPDPSLRTIDDGVSVLGADDITPVSPLSRFYLLMDAFRAMDDAVSADPAAEAAFERVGDLLWDRFLQVEQTADGWRLANRQAWYLLLTALDFARARARVHLDAGDLSAELSDLQADAADAVGGRVLPRLVTAWNLIADHPELPARFDGLALDLLSHENPTDVREARRLGAWAVQHMQVDAVTVPIAHTLAKQIDPESVGWRFEPGAACTPLPSEFEPQARLRMLSQAMWLLRHVLRLEADDGTGAMRRVAADMVTNATTKYPNTDQTPLDDLLAIIAAVHRADPTQTGELLPADMASFLFEAGDYMLDEERGVEKLYQQIERRDGF